MQLKDWIGKKVKINCHAKGHPISMEPVFIKAGEVLSVDGENLLVKFPEAHGHPACVFHPDNLIEVK